MTQFGNNVPIPEPKPVDFSNGESWYDGLFNGVAGIFQNYLQYDTTKSLLESNNDAMRRQNIFDQQFQTASIQRASMSTSTIMTLGLMAVGALVLTKVVK